MFKESKLIHPSKTDQKFKQYPIVIIATGWETVFSS